MVRQPGDGKRWKKGEIEVSEPRPLRSIASLLLGGFPDDRV